MPTAASELLSPNLLDEVSILVVAASSPAAGGKQDESFAHAHAVGDACERLGSHVVVCEYDGAVEEAAMDRAVASATAESEGLDMLVVDGVALFASGGLHACLEGAWNATRTVVNHAILPAGRGGRIVYLAPPPGADRSKIVQQAGAARAGLENLARTLSVEWARHRITVVTIALGDTTAPGEAAALTAYLASPAGAYFSGCLLDLRGV
ncbi:MAG TPA: SDR family NAD(P)-dependent oxidoreductase [Solirubrobacteraceae bacterium]|jgi:NAD(P)-dependent dehydrogenase (short-subunit alcohol dehydrogenase family)|nr:SDR family NAD(P)-dependent oxidoreductase [Solirubrobacteraceae bacterium]